MKTNLREIQVLDVLWSTDVPMTAVDIIKKKPELTQSTVTAVLRKLLHNKLVEVVGVTHSGKVLSRTYRPTEASQSHLLQDFVQSYCSFKGVIPPSQICAKVIFMDGYNKEEAHEILRKLEEEQLEKEQQEKEQLEKEQLEKEQQEKGQPEEEQP